MKVPSRSNWSTTPSTALVTTRLLLSGVSATAAGALSPLAPAGMTLVAVMPAMGVAQAVDLVGKEPE